MLEGLPDKEGIWKVDYDEPINYKPLEGFTNSRPNTIEIEVYSLDPVGGILCVWIEDIGGSIDGPSEVWDTDEWLGHIPVYLFSNYYQNTKFTWLRES